MAAGEKALGETDMIHSARATSEVPITVRGNAKAKARILMALKPDRLGAGRLKVAWQPHGTLLAVASEKDGQTQVATFTRSGEQLQCHALGKGSPKWCEWDCSGATLGFHQARRRAAARRRPTRAARSRARPPPGREPPPFLACRRGALRPPAWPSGARVRACAGHGGSLPVG